jgi:hypothetical protein
MSFFEKQRAQNCQSWQYTLWGACHSNNIGKLEVEEVNKPQSTSFKTCTKCGFVWPERLSFLSDPQLRIVGYQVDFDELVAGLFLFNHSCGTTFSVKAGDFRDLYNGPIFKERLNGTEKCPSYCLYQNDLHPCPAKCECAYVLEITQVVLKWPKTLTGETQASRP